MTIKAFLQKRKNIIQSISFFVIVSLLQFFQLYLRRHRIFVPLSEFVVIFIASSSFFVYSLTGYNIGHGKYFKFLLTVLLLLLLSHIFVYLIWFFGSAGGSLKGLAVNHVSQLVVIYSFIGYSIGIIIFYSLGTLINYLVDKLKRKDIKKG